MNYWIVPTVLKQNFTKSEREELASDILKTVSNYYGVSIEDIKGRCRKRKIVKPRQVIMFLLRTKARMVLSDIGEVLNRDHTTVIHSITCIQNDITHPYDDSLEKDLININILL
jgi:chromosomal replication initiator protein